ncbi:hypothetical protein IMCC3317_22760 [Kordia antarctica]|uniref:Uncharacterized protein n=1 Tax=Kordia antarctica TaxID=1218801 RepID=A0A7L4ZL04_9FLAO|nr:hypothetical protein [Kordia antarctica]QHI36906.1 hypothetical protein IMCC3317_22760 [Kordia antarctica]
MKKKNLNKKLTIKTISVSNLNELQGGRSDLAAGTHEPCEVYELTDWCTMFGCPPIEK